jgi:hypothetical protein
MKETLRLPITRPDPTLQPTMSTPSRFEIPFDDTALEHRLPPPRAAVFEDDLQVLAKEICELDPDLADILFGSVFATKSREERLAQISAWAEA